MIQILNKNDDLTEYENFVSSNKYGHFMQSTKWAKLKSAWNYNIIILRNKNNNIIGSMLVLIRKINKFMPYTIMYAPRGPIYDFNDENRNTILLELFNAAKKIALKNKSWIFKIDPNISNVDKKIELEKFGFKLNNSGKNFEAIQPKFIFRLNTYRKNIKEIFDNFSSRTRYNIRYAIKKGVYVKICDQNMLPVFYNLMLETSIRDNFLPRNLKYFQEMINTLGNDVRLYIAFTKENLPIAGSIAVNYSKKTWYLYGASANTNRNLMPNYLLQYEMIKWAIDTQCYFYDFRGISGDIYDKNNPLYGLYRFKKGFSGEIIELIGEYDLTMNNYMNFLFNNTKKIYTYFRRKIYIINKWIKKFF